MESPTSTLGLVERVKGGDTEAFSLLFRKYQRRLAVLIYYRMGPELRGYAECDDLLQETFLAASQQLSQFNYRGPGSFMAWLSRIAAHAVVDAARFHGRQKRDGGEKLRFRSASNPSGPEPTDRNTPSRIFAQEERMRALLAKLDELPAEQRDVILLAKFEGLSTQEISNRTGKSREAMALLLHRALKRFREMQPLKESS
jgi:RNA polymerase sigma-70 factor (ECF subfamily)